MRARRAAYKTTVIATVLAALYGCAPSSTSSAAPPGGAERSRRLRDDALRRARVWHAPEIPIGQVGFSEPSAHAGRFVPEAEVSCRFVERRVGGTTPKFYCDPGDGAVKVKYGGSNPELQAELAATRLLSALGFGADRMFSVRTLRCRGCPPFPFQALRCAAETPFSRACFAGADERHEISFDHPVIEREMTGRPVEYGGGEGWAWFELSQIDSRLGGSSAAEVDAFRLLAVFLAHWDNKAENQRLVCLPGGERDDGSCGRPAAIIQDLGATFGPLKADLVNWSRTAVWAVPGSCQVSMRQLPFDGGTFPDSQISEAGRRLLADLLTQLSRRQIVDLFVSSRFGDLAAVSADARRPEEWASVFERKVQEIASARCPH